MTAKKSTRRPRRRPRKGLKLNTRKGANQADKQGADVNTIVAQYRKSGTMPRVGLKNPLYGDFTFPEDIHEQREAMFRAEDRFMDLPSAVRAKADNDWVKFLTMFEDPEKRSWLETAGLVISDNSEPETDSPPPPSPGTPTPPPVKTDDN